jgi:intracellular septation protein
VKEVFVEEQNQPKAGKGGTPLVKLGIEYGPVIIFFLTWLIKGIFVATGALMVATLVSVAASWIVMKRVPPMLLVTAALVMSFGALTIYLHDDTFIKMKPTILYVLFASILAAGLVWRKPLLKAVFGEVFQMKDEGWRLLTYRFIGFFACLAVMNEIVWRNFSEAVWVGFKSFGVMPLMVLFMMLQITLISKYQIAETSSDSSEISPT